MTTETKASEMTRQELVALPGHGCLSYLNSEEGLRRYGARERESILREAGAHQTLQRQLEVCSTGFDMKGIEDIKRVVERVPLDPRCLEGQYYTARIYATDDRMKVRHTTWPDPRFTVLADFDPDGVDPVKVGVHRRRAFALVVEGLLRDKFCEVHLEVPPSVDTKGESEIVTWSLQKHCPVVGPGLWWRCDDTYYGIATETLSWIPADECLATLLTWARS